MRRTVTIFTSILIVLSGVVFAADNNKERQDTVLPAFTAQKNTINFDNLPQLKVDKHFINNLKGGPPTSNPAPTHISVGRTSSDFTIVLYDSYGDGWNGGAIDVTVNAAVVLDDITITSGAGPDEHTFAVEDGDAVVVDYTAGSWSSENSYYVYDHNGDLVASSGVSGTPEDVSFTASVPPLTADFTLSLVDSYGDGWNGGAIDVTADMTVASDIVFTGEFGGATDDNAGTYTFPTGAESWAGFANEDVSIYPFSFPNGSEITFTGATAGTDVDLYFRFEYNAYPDTDPAFSTASVTVSGTDEASYSVAIPAQDAANTYSSFLLYVTTQDAAVTLSNVTIRSGGTVVLDDVTVASGSTADYTFTVEDGSGVFVDYTAGSWSTENSYYVYDNVGNLVASSGASGTPGDVSFTAVVVTEAPPVELVINEIHYNPASSQGNDDEYEFLELYNAGVSAADLEGYTFTEGVVHTFAAGASIAAGEYIILAVDSSSYSGSASQVFQWESGALGNGGEDIIITDASGTVMDSVVYDDYDPWPTDPDGGGPSLSLTDPTLDNSDPANWEASWPHGGTPGGTDDNAEDNDIYTDATSIAAGTYQFVAEDDDWYTTMVNAGDVITVTISWVDDTNTDLDLIIYDGNLAYADGSMGYSSPEIVEYTAVYDSEFVLIKVDLWAGGDNYTMDVDVQLAPIVAGWTDSFEDGAADGWTIIDSDANGYSWATSTYGGSAYDGETYVSCGFSVPGNDDWLISPQLAVANFDAFSFWITNNSSSYQEEIEVWLSTTGGDSTGAFDVRLDSLSIQENYTYIEKSYDLSAYAGTLVTIALRSIGVDQYYTYVDLFALTSDPPTGSVQGTVISSASGSAIDSALVSAGSVSAYTATDGSYLLETTVDGEAVVGITVDKAGYLSASFTVTMTEDDTLLQDVALIPLDSVASVAYSTGFEPGEDTGWTSTGGANPFEVSGGFTFDTLTVAPFAGDSMMVCSPTGYANSEFSWWMNLTNSDMDLSGFLGAELTLQMNYWTEAGYDNIILLATMPEIYGTSYYYLDVNGDGVGNSSDAISGSSDGWVEVTADLTPFVGTSYGVEVAVLLMADATVNEGFGVAIDDVTVNGFNEPRPTVTDLTAESFVDDQVHLMWSDPTGGERTQSTQTITTDRTAIEVSPRNPRKAFEYEINDAEIEYTIPARTDRDLVSFNVFRSNEFLPASYGVYEFVGNTAVESYTDSSVVNHSLYYYFVTAVYDEGESAGSNWAAAGAGSVTDAAMADVAVDFEDSTFGAWQVMTDTDNGWDVGDSATAASAFSTVPDNGGYFAFVNDDAVGSGVSSQSRLVSPFLNLGDADHATLSFDYFNENAFSQNLLLYAWVGWDTWYYLGALTQNGEWQTASVDVSFLSGMDHVRFYFHYDDNGGGWAYSVAVDNIVVETLDGPTGLTLASSVDGVTLSWTGVGSQAMRANEYPDMVPQEEKDLALDLGGIGNSGQTDHDGEDNFSRAQGDSIGNPFVIDALPFSTTGSTVGFTDDYDEVCPYTGSTSPDVVYELTIGDLEGSLIIDLCESYYDTKVYVYKDDADTTLFACNDDFCTASHGQTYTSYLELSPDSLVAGTYFIVIDGYGGAEGEYALEVSVSEPPPPMPDVMYSIYKEGAMVAAGLDTTVFVDDDATLDEACYVVTASVRTLGTEGDTLSYVETGPSNEECGALLNAAPGVFTLYSPADGDTIVIDQSNLGSDQAFAWGASTDPNGTAVEYEVCVTVAAPFDQFCDDNGASTAQFVPLADIADYIDSLNQAAGTGVVLSFNWTVYASDGVNETEASNGPLSVTFDAGWVLSVDEEMGIPDVFALHQNYPNPFNPVTTIRFDVPQESHIRMDIYNILGQRVRTLVNSDMQAGYHTIRWNGTNDMGKPLSSGMYIYRIHSSEFTSVKKLVLMK